MIVDPTYHGQLTLRQPLTIEYKQYRAAWYEYPRHDIVTAYPMHIDLELNTTCNLKCPMCLREHFPPAPANMPVELAKKIIDEASVNGTKSLKLQCRGEPLLYPHLLEVIKYAKSRNILEVMFNSNCTLLTPEMSKALICAGLDKIVCSVDTHEPYRYARIRRGADFDQTYRNINQLRQIRENYRSQTPYIRIQMIDMVINHDTLPFSVKFWSSIADEVSIIDCLDYSNRIEIKKHVPTWKCAQPWQRLLILADGTVIPCTGLYSDAKIVGNANTQSLKEIWNSKQMNRIRDIHRTGKTHKLEMCRICPLRRRFIE